MTPAINAAKKARITYKLHEYRHDPSSESYGTEAAEKLGVPPERLFKTLVVSLDDRDLAVAILPVSSLLNMKRVAKAAGAKKANMAAKADEELATGYTSWAGSAPWGRRSG